MNGAAIAIGGEGHQPATRRAPTWSEGSDRRALLAGLLVFVGYYLGAKLGFALTFDPHPVSVLWPPNSVLVSALLLAPPRRWWLLILAALPAHWIVQLQHEVPSGMILCWFVSNVCEALIGAGGVWLLLGQPIRFNRLRNVGIFCFCVVFVGPVLSSFLDAGFVIWNRFGSDPYWEIWRIRTTSNVLAALIVAPLVITWVGGTHARRFPSSARRWIEAALLFFALLLMSLTVLYGTDAEQKWLLPYLPLSFLIWAAVRFGSLGASTAIATIGFLTIWNAAHGHGPFSDGSPEQNALSIQIFLIVVAVPILFLGTLIEELATGETELVESERRFRTMADAAPVLLWMSGTDKLCTFFNKAWIEFTGRKMEEELGNGWSEGVHHDDFEECLRTYITAFDQRKPFTMKYRLRRYDGEYRFISDTAVPRYGLTGDFRGYIGACVDITDLVEQKRVLREYEERAALATEAAHLGLWERDLVSESFWISDKARELFQFGPSETVTYDKFRARAHPEDLVSSDLARDGAMAVKGGYELEYRILLPDGTIRWIAGRARCILDENGNIARLLGVAMDVTERKQTQELLQLATEASHLGVWDWDETSGKLSWDGAMREIFDVTREGEVTLDTFYRAVYPQDLERVKQVWRHAVESGVPYELEYRVQRSNGTISWVLARGHGFYDDRRRPVRMIGIVFDITDRKQAEEEAQRRRDEIDRLSRISLLGEMTGSIAHELNQPLSGIMSNASAGQRFIDRGEVDAAELREILADIAADGRRASDVIRHIRNTIKNGTALRERLNINDVIGRVAHMVQPDTFAHSCELELSLAKDLPVVEGDPIQIQQVLINLVTNACDAMDKIPVSQRKVKIATEGNGTGSIKVTVRDQGPGVSAEVREHLFDQFFTTKEEGLGMGLAIVRSIVESHGGKIDVENLNGSGACFYFTLPATM